MKIYPAVDIKDGKCVRLKMGNAADKTVYFENPVDAAKSFADAGSDVIHVVDLDGAFSGESSNLPAISRIAQLGMFVELGGGLRDEASVRRAFDAGAGRAIIGTKACTNPDFAAALAEKYGGKIAAGIDARGGKVAIKGWVELSGLDSFDLAVRLARGGVKTFVYTDIDTDGMLAGPNLAAQKKMLETLSPYGARLVASGGVSSEGDVSDFLGLARSHGNLEGVIVGKAIYERRVDLRKIVKMASCP